MPLTIWAGVRPVGVRTPSPPSRRTSSKTAAYCALARAGGGVGRTVHGRLAHAGVARVAAQHGVERFEQGQVIDRQCPRRARRTELLATHACRAGRRRMVERIGTQRRLAPVAHCEQQSGGRCGTALYLLGAVRVRRLRLRRLPVAGKERCEQRQAGYLAQRFP